VRRNVPASEYPAEARRRGVETDCVLQIDVGVAGEIVDIPSLQCGETGLGFEDLARRWTLQEYRFNPAIVNGEPVRQRVRWTFRFRIEES
jgi:TonB family protein